MTQLASFAPSSSVRRYPSISAQVSSLRVQFPGLELKRTSLDPRARSGNGRSRRKPDITCAAVNVVVGRKAGLQGVAREGPECMPKSPFYCEHETRCAAQKRDMEKALSRFVRRDAMEWLTIRGPALSSCASGWVTKA